MDSVFLPHNSSYRIGLGSRSTVTHTRIELNMDRICVEIIYIVIYIGSFPVGND